MTREEDNENLVPSDNYAVFRIRDFRLYMIGRLFAVIGSQMLTVAVGWELYERTNSALALGIVGLTEMIAMFACTLPAGHIADNVNRKRIILTALAINCVSSLGLTVISWEHAPVVCIYMCLFLTAASRTFMWPASSAFLTSLVPRELFPRAVTWNSGVFQLSSVAGPAIGGALIAILKRYSDHPAAFIYFLNFGTALTCLLTVKMIRAQQAKKRGEPMSLKSFATGFNFVFTQRLILGMITLDMFAVFLGGATSLLPVYAKDILHSDADGLGLLQAALPLGSVLCALYLAHRPPLQKAGPALLWCVVVFGVATIGFGMANGYALGHWLQLNWPDHLWFWIAFAMLLICGAADNVSVVMRHTSVQLLTPDDKRGRVSAVNSLFIGTSNELGGFESGSVAHLFGPAMGHAITTGAIISVISGGLGTILVVAAVAAFWPEIRKYGKLA